jgi:hypothetical protein
MQRLQKWFNSQVKQCSTELKFLQNFKPVLLQNNVQLTTWEKLFSSAFRLELDKLNMKPQSFVLGLPMVFIAVDCFKLEQSKLSFSNPVIMLFSENARQQLLLGKQNSTVKILSGIGKYRQGKTYQCGSYDGDLWDIWIKVLSIENMKIKYIREDIRSNKQLQSSIRSQGVNLDDYCDVIKFKVVKT